MNEQNPLPEEPTSPYRQSTQHLDEMAAAVKKVISEVRLLYSTPKQVRNESDAANYLALLSQSMVEECRNPEILREAWKAFKRAHARGFWPTPGELCQHVRREQIDRRQYTQPIPAERRLPPRDFRAPERVSHQTRDATLKALAAADTMAQSTNPLERNYGEAFVKLGLALIERNGDPA